MTFRRIVRMVRSVLSHRNHMRRRRWWKPSCMSKIDDATKNNKKKKTKKMDIPKKTWQDAIILTSCHQICDDHSSLMSQRSTKTNDDDDDDDDDDDVLDDSSTDCMGRGISNSNSDSDSNSSSCSSIDSWTVRKNDDDDDDDDNDDDPMDRDIVRRDDRTETATFTSGTYPVNVSQVRRRCQQDVTNRGTSNDIIICQTRKKLRDHDTCQSQILKGPLTCKEKKEYQANRYLMSTNEEQVYQTPRPFQGGEVKHKEEEKENVQGNNDDEGDEEGDHYNINSCPVLNTSSRRYSLVETSSNTEEEILFTDDCRDDDDDEEESYDNFSDVSSLTRGTLSSERRMVYFLQMKMIPARISMKTIKTAINMSAKIRQVRKIRSLIVPAISSQSYANGDDGEEKCNDPVHGTGMFQSSKCLVMLICPNQKIFEIVPVEYQPDTSTVDDLLAQIPLRACSDFRLRFQQYTGLLYLDTKENAAANEDTRNKMNGRQGGTMPDNVWGGNTMDAVRPVNQQYNLDYNHQSRAPLVAIPVQFTAPQMEAFARMLLDNPKVARALRDLHDFLISGLGF